MNCIVDPYSGEVFNIPNFCICDPVHKKIIKKDNVIEEKSIKIELIYVFKNLSHYIQASNKSFGIDIKKIFCKLENICVNKHQIRLLSKGQEIKDQIELFHYNIDETDKIQVSCRPLEDSEL